MKLLKNILILGIILIMNSCSNTDEISYTLDVFNEDGIGFFSDLQIDGNQKEMVEDGDWSIFDKTGKLLQQGKFEVGIRVGDWVYNINGNVIEINWNMRSLKNLKFSIPIGWKEIEVDNYKYFSYFGGDDSIVNNNYFIINTFDRKIIDDISKDTLSVLEKYCDYYKYVTKNQNNVVSVIDNEIELNSGSKLRMLRFLIDNNEKVESISLIRELNNNIIECTIKVDESKREQAILCLFSILRGLQFCGDRCFSPFDNVRFIDGQLL